MPMFAVHCLFSAPYFSWHMSRSHFCRGRCTREPMLGANARAPLQLAGRKEGRDQIGPKHQFKSTQADLEWDHRCLRAPIWRVWILKLTCCMGFDLTKTSRWQVGRSGWVGVRGVCCRQVQASLRKCYLHEMRTWEVCNRSTAPSTRPRFPLGCRLKSTYPHFF